MYIRNLLQLVCVWELIGPLLPLLVRKNASVNIKLCKRPHWQSSTAVHGLRANTLLWKLPRESACHLVARKGGDGLRAKGWEVELEGRLYVGGGDKEGRESINR